MIIGIPTEILSNENRVGIVPAGVRMLVAAGHHVLIQQGAGLGSSISDEEFRTAGAQLLPTGADVFAAADMIIKVKEPLAQEYALMRRDQILFTYLHMAADPALAKALIDRGVVAIGYETVQLQNGTLPLLIPMSEVAGRMSVQIGARFLEKQAGGSGVLLGGVPGVEPGHVAIIGGGIVGMNAARVAVGFGAQVTIIDVNASRLRQLDELFEGRVSTLMSNEYNIARTVLRTDLLIGAVLIPGAKAPRLVTESMVAQMSPGSVIVDVAIDQGGCIETADHTSTHTNPIYLRHNVLHYSVPNIPGAVARTSTFALTNATMHYALMLANMGWEAATKAAPELALGLNVAKGKVVHPAVANALGYA